MINFKVFSSSYGVSSGGFCGWGRDLANQVNSFMSKCNVIDVKYIIHQEKVQNIWGALIHTVETYIVKYEGEEPK